MHISNILKEGELQSESVVKNYLTTALDGKQYNVTFYSLDMILAIGFRARSKRGTQFRIWTVYEQFHAKRKALAAAEADVQDQKEITEAVDLFDLQDTLQRRK